MNATQIIQAMTTLVEAPGYPLLKYWKTDFAADKLQIEANWHPHARMLWVVRECGTQLCALGVHPKQQENVRCVVQSHETDTTKGSIECYLLTPKGIEPVSKAHALQLLQKFDYQVNDDQILDANGAPLACFDIQLTTVDNRLLGDVDFQALNPEIKTQRQHLLALMTIAECEVRKAWASLFTSARKITLNGEDLHAMLKATPEMECV